MMQRTVSGLFLAAYVFCLVWVAGVDLLVMFLNMWACGCVCKTVGWDMSCFQPVGQCVLNVHLFSLISWSWFDKLNGILPYLWICQTLSTSGSSTFQGWVRRRFPAALNSLYDLLVGARHKTRQKYLITRTCNQFPQNTSSNRITTHGRQTLVVRLPHLLAELKSSADACQRLSDHAINYALYFQMTFTTH